MNQTNPSLSSTTPFAVLSRLFRPKSARRTTPSNLFERLESIRQNYVTATETVAAYHKAVEEGRAHTTAMMSRLEEEAAKVHEMKYLPDALLAAELAAAERAATLRAAGESISRVMALASDAQQRDRYHDAVAPLHQLLAVLTKVQESTKEN